MRTIETQVYKFSELSKEAKEEAIKKYYEREDYPLLTTDLLESLKELDTLNIFSDIKMQYSLSYCQGDGLSFEADIDLMAWLKARNMKTSVVDAVYNSIEQIQSVGNTGRYCYANDSQIEIEIDGQTPKRIYKLCEQIRDEIAEYYMDICHKLEKEGYGMIEYRMKDEDFSDFSDSNDYEYTVDGKLI